MSEETKKEREEFLEFPYTMVIPTRFATGPCMGKFLSELRDNKRILGNVCPQCRRTMLPPRIICAECHCEVGADFVELGPRGTVITYDVVFVPFINPLTGKPREVPYTTAFILLDGGNTTFFHFLQETDPAKLRVGMRVEAVFREERRGDATDILYFKTVEE